MRVMTYNIQIAVSGATNPKRELDRFDLPGVARVIAAQAPDVVVLQEVDRGRGRSGGVDQAAWLADRLKYHHVFGASYVVDEPEGKKGEYGNAILSRWPIVSSHVVPLWHREKPEGDEPAWVVEPRSCLKAVVDGPSPVAVLGLHLSTTADQRARQLDQVAEVIDDLGETPAVLMGDFNALPDELAASKLPDRMENLLGEHSVPTFPNGKAARKALDHIWVSPHWRAETVWVVSELAGVSDHNPVVADLVRH